MAKHGYTAEIVCPYYKYEAPQVIYCEGVEDQTALHLAFARKERKREYVITRCGDCWRKCLIAQMLNRKYDYE